MSASLFVLNHLPDDWGIGMIRRFKEIKKPIMAFCHLEPENSTDINMCWSQWANDVVSEVAQMKIKFPTHQSLRREDMRGEQF